MLAEIKQFIKTHQTDIILVIGVILISLLSFATGYITAKQQEKKPLRIEETTYEKPESGYYRSGSNRSLFGLEAFEKRT